MVEEGKDGANIRWGLDKTIIVVIASHLYTDHHNHKMVGDGDGDGGGNGDGDGNGEWMDGWMDNT